MKFPRQIYGVVPILVIVTGCSSIPSNSPSFLKDNATLIHTRIETLSTAIETSANSSKKSLESLDYIKKLLTVDPVDKTKVHQQLVIIEQTLKGITEFGTLPSKARKDASFISSNLDLMASILQQQVDVNALIGDLKSKVEALNKE